MSARERIPALATRNGWNAEFQGHVTGKYRKGDVTVQVRYTYAGGVYDAQRYDDGMGAGIPVITLGPGDRAKVQTITGWLKT